MFQLISSLSTCPNCSLIYIFYHNLKNFRGFPKQQLELVNLFHRDGSGLTGKTSGKSGKSHLLSASEPFLLFSHNLLWPSMSSDIPSNRFSLTLLRRDREMRGGKKVQLKKTLILKTAYLYFQYMLEKSKHFQRNETKTHLLPPPHTLRIVFHNVDLPMLTCWSV